jgi:hypothetical protein
MTNLLGDLVVDDPCPRCGDREIWLMRYLSAKYGRFVCICKRCGNTLVAEPKRVLLARTGQRMSSLMPKRPLDFRE